MSYSITPPSTSQAAVIGDIHGDYGAFLAALSTVGVECHNLCEAESEDERGRHGCWPENLWVVQLGDQIHRGEDGDLVLKLRNKLRAHSSGRFVDLWGNHEAQYRGGPRFWRTRNDHINPDHIDPDTSRAAAAAIVTERRVWIASHAGITRGWLDAAREKTQSDFADPAEIAVEANRQWIRRDPALLRSGVMLGSVGRFHPGAVNHAAGPLWAELGQEVLDSWGSGEGLDFSQIVGHSRIFDWEGNTATWQARVDGVAVKQDREKRHSIVEFARQHDRAGQPHQLVCVEPQHSPRSRVGIVPYVIEDVIDVVTDPIGQVEAHLHPRYAN